VEEGEVVPGRLFEPCRKTSKAFQVVEEDFDAIAHTVSLPIQARLHAARWVRMDDGLHSVFADPRANSVGVVSRVRYERLPVRVLLDDRLGNRRLVLLAGGEFDVDWPALRVDKRVDFGRETTSRTTQCVGADPPFPPAASWWARTIEASMMTPSLSASSWSVLKMAAQYPRCAHVVNLLYTDFQGPKRSGRSLQGIPVLARNSTASMNARSPFFGAGPRRLGSARLTASHSASVRACRCVTPGFDHARTPYLKFLRRNVRK